MKMSRRAMLQSIATFGAASALPAVVDAGTTPALAVYDSRLPESIAFARTALVRGIRTVDIAPGDKAIWSFAKQEPASPGSIIGMTGWSDWVILRGLLEEKGKRLASETRVAHRGSRPATPYEWEMA